METSRNFQQQSGTFASLRQHYLFCYDELHSLARQKLRFEYHTDTLDTSALVHEAFLKLENRKNGFANKRHFMAIAALVMRRFLVDYARQKKRIKRGGDQIQLTYGDIEPVVQTTPEEVIQLNDALMRLKAFNNRYCRVVEYHFFGGYKHEEIAEMLGVSIDTVRKDWRFAKAWLSKELKN
ncbi:RNA polymerase sigma factor, TIGR02999 family [Cyclobacterium xiamenense]|uniref:RNA polymerase sigma factor, TIGR02999 family n=1 Tax=Cyclobacterium xiamenense TaxID=1297121 RepID=A0A1H6VZ59_9BACT|nr:ECF-type sigma factor [Cyclobacterium xiamenense]SEJ09929.1 RNA polymerase sigma factor, TIGR02999 family [Cyclobacterium xiamenense]